MIYLLEDETNIRNLIVYTLNNSGLSADGFATAGEFWEAFREKTPSLVLLDIMLPDEDGLEVLKKIRASSVGKNLPVMMLTAKATEYDKVLGLDLGADDYLPKPFGMMEMVARVKSLLRRTAVKDNSSGEYTIGDLFVSVPKHLVKVSGKPVILTLKEFDILALLIRNSGNVTTRDKLISEVWGYDFLGGSRTVDVHIRTLRAKLGSCADLIETVRGVGYRIEAGV